VSAEHSGRTAGLTGSSEDFSRLCNILRSDPSQDVRYWALFQVDAVRSATEALPILLEALLDPDEDVWAEASRWVRRKERTEAVERIATEWVQSSSPTRRVQAARAFARSESESSSGILERLLQDEDLSVKTAAAVALKFRFRDYRFSMKKEFPESLPPLFLEGLKSDDEDLRIQCALAGAYIGLTEALPVLLDRLNDPRIDTGDYMAALWAVDKIPGEEATERLCKELKSPEPQLRLSALNALARKENLERLLTRYEEGNKSLRLRIIGAIGNYDAPGVFPVLLKAVEKCEEPAFTDACRAFRTKIRLKKVEDSKIEDLEVLLHRPREDESRPPKVRNLAESVLETISSHASSQNP